MAQFGPNRPQSKENELYDSFRTPLYLTGHAKKMRSDLERVFRMYWGKEVKVFQKQRDAARCPECTDVITGQVMLANCPVCNGTGVAEQYEDVGDFWARVDIGPVQKTSGAMGSQENLNLRPDQFTLVGAPLLEDQDLIALIDTKSMYKVVDVEPAIVALSGEVITQVANISYLTPGSSEYKYLTP